MFWTRLISAIIFGTIVVIAIQMGNHLTFFIIVSIFVILSAIEFLNLANPSENSVIKCINVFTTWLVCLSSFKPDWIDINLVFCLAIGLPFIIEIIKRKPKLALLSASSAILGFFYIGWLFGRHLILLRQMSDGKLLIFLLISVAWSSDIGAYLIGKKFGKHKIIPSISPGKSLEGFISGIAFGVLASLFSYFYLNINPVHAIIMGIMLTIIGQLGDLAESLMKRSANVKDSGKLMPGHGGILDRCDSMIFITPALYYYCMSILKLK